MRLLTLALTLSFVLGRTPPLTPIKILLLTLTLPLTLAQTCVRISVCGYIAIAAPTHSGGLVVWLLALSFTYL